PSWCGRRGDPECAPRAPPAASERDGKVHRVTQRAFFDLADPIGDIWPVVSQTGVAWLLSRHADWKGNVGGAIAAMAEAGAKLSAVQYLGALDAGARRRPRVAPPLAPFRPPPPPTPPPPPSSAR